jgi:hypothetical protein
MKLIHLFHVLVTFGGLQVFASPTHARTQHVDKIAQRDLISTILNDIENAAGCAGCEV